MKKRLLLALLAVTLSLGLCSCGALKELEEDDDGEFDIEKVMKNLDDGGYYIVHNNIPTKLYFGEASFDEGSVTTVSSIDTNTDRIMWFTDDWEEIPTMYEGDTLIFYSTEELTEEFNFERFEDFGYSIGVCKMQETVSGRYKISTDVTNRTTYPGHDTEPILNFEQDNVIIEAIGGKPLRKNNVTRAGSVYGLSKDSTYSCDIYGGTELTRIDCTADVRILGSMQQKTTNDFNFLSSTVIKVNIPEWFNNGYYTVDGLGIFRYITGKNYTETMNLNIPNTDPDASTSENVEDESIVTENLFVGTNQLGTRRLTIDLSIPKKEDLPEGEADMVPAVEVTITAPDGTAWSKTEVDYQIVIDYDAELAGKYTFTLSNLGNRTYTYDDGENTAPAEEVIENVEESESLEEVEQEQ